MKEFEYTIRDPLGIHARPAGLLAREAKQFDSVCTISQNGRDARRLTQLMLVMAMGVRKGDTVTIRCEGRDEEAAATALKAFFEKNL